MGVTPPQRPVALWRLDDLRGSVELDPEHQRAVVAIPTVGDDQGEAREVVALRFQGDQLLRQSVVRVAAVRDGDA
jgi:hypothetical protein